MMCPLDCHECPFSDECIDDDEYIGEEELL